MTLDAHIPLWQILIQENVVNEFPLRVKNYFITIYPESTFLCRVICVNVG